MATPVRAFKVKQTGKNKWFIEPEVRRNLNGCYICGINDKRWVNAQGNRVCEQCYLLEMKERGWATPPTEEI